MRMSALGAMQQTSALQVVFWEMAQPIQLGCEISEKPIRKGTQDGLKLANKVIFGLSDFGLETVNWWMAHELEQNICHYVRVDLA